MQTRMFRTEAPWAPLAIGLAGLIPFVFIAGAICVGASLPLHGAGAALVRALIVYAAVILSFLGGVRWGVALGFDEKAAKREFVIAVAPSLAGWFAALCPPTTGLWVLCVAFVGLGAFDYASFAGGAAPDWYRRLRVGLTAVAALSLLLAAAIPR